MNRERIYEGLSRVYFSEERHEKEATDHLPELLGNAKLFVDVGASLGQYTFFANQYLRGARIYAIEADPIRFDKLQTNCKLWETQSGNSITAVHAAANDKNGMETFLTTQSTLSGALFRRSFPGKDISWHEVTVPSVTLDTIFNDCTPDVIKIDVEGAELRVLKGSSRILGDGQPKLLVELHQGIDPRGQNNPYELIEFLSRFGYLKTRFYGRDLFLKTQ